MKTKRYLLAMMIAGILMIFFGCAEKNSSLTKKTDTEPVSQVETGDAVVTIEGTTLTYDDMEFYTFIQKLKNESNRIADAKHLQGEDLEKSEAYWNTQNEHYEKTNAQLQHMIEIHSMSLLAEEKNYFVPDDQLNEAIEELKLVIESNEVLKKMLNDYGEKNFRLSIPNYMRESLLRDRIVNDIEKTVLDEIPNASEQELKYEVNTRYDDLAMEQLSSLEMKIHLK